MAATESRPAQAIPDAEAAGDPDTGESYYEHWLDALERLLAAKDLVTGAMHEAQHPRDHLSLRLEKIDGKAQGGRRPGGFVRV